MAYFMMILTKLTNFLKPVKKAVFAGIFTMIAASCLQTAQAQDSGPSLPGSSGNASRNQEDSSLSFPGDDSEAFDFDNEETFDFEKSPEELEQEVRREAFDAALEGLLPLRPGEIRELLEHFDRTQESVELPVHPYPKPEISVQTLSLDPGTEPATVKTAYGHVTTINMLDITGAPWPILNITWAGNFEVVENESEEGKGAHIIRISPESEFAHGNISISMLNLKTPIIMTLEASREPLEARTRVDRWRRKRRPDRW